MAQPQKTKADKKIQEKQTGTNNQSPKTETSKKVISNKTDNWDADETKYKNTRLQR